MMVCGLCGKIHQLLFVYKEETDRYYVNTYNHQKEDYDSVEYTDAEFRAYLNKIHIEGLA